MKKIKISVLVALVLLGGYGCSSDSTNTSNDTTANEAESGMSSDTTTAASATAQADTASFPVKAASGSMMEITAGNVAQQKGVNPEVKKFGQQMVTDHGKASTELQNIAASKNIVLPTSPLPKHQRQIEVISELDGAEFDRSYMTAMVKAHQEDVALFESFANDTGADADLKAFAEKTLPTLRMHLDMAQKTQAKVK